MTKSCSTPRSTFVYSTDREDIVRALLAKGEDAKQLVRFLNVGRQLTEMLKIVTWCAPLLGMTDAEFMRIARRGRGATRG